MVDTLEPFAKELADLKQDLPEILRKILIKRRDEVIKILKNDQLSEGLDSSGKVVGTYSYLTEEYAKDPYNKPRKDKEANQPYNFEWTGGLFDNFYMHFEDLNSFSLFSQDSKAKMLEEEYGDIFTLTKLNNEYINQEILRPAMYDAIINRLFI